MRLGELCRAPTIFSKNGETRMICGTATTLAQLKHLGYVRLALASSESHGPEGERSSKYLQKLLSTVYHVDSAELSKLICRSKLTANRV